MINRALQVLLVFCFFLNNKFKDRKTKVYSVLVWISESYCFLGGPLISSRDVDLRIYKTKGRQTLWGKIAFSQNLRLD